MTIFRRRHTANFTTISNRLFDDDRLAADEVGILAYLLSRPHDWEVRRPALQRRWSIGREAMKRIMFAWLRTGWCVATRMRAPNGTSYVIYDIRDEPGSELSEEEVRRALSLVSSEAVGDEIHVNLAPGDVPETGGPPTGYPSLADPSPVEPYVADNNILNTELPRNDSDQKAEREHERAKEKHALDLVEFKRRWPTASSDDQALIDGAWFDLTFEEGEAALGNIARFLEKQKRDGRTKICAGQTYLRQKRWTLLDQPKSEAPTSATNFAKDSVEAKAITALYDIAGKFSFFAQVARRADGSVDYRHPMTDQLRALAQASRREKWVALTHQQAGAWEGLLREALGPLSRFPLREGSLAPWYWPPNAEGKIYENATGPPTSLMTDQDFSDFK